MGSKWLNRRVASASFISGAEECESHRNTLRDKETESSEEQDSEGNEEVGMLFQGPVVSEFGARKRGDRVERGRGCKGWVYKYSIVWTRAHFSQPERGRP
jgi:hypothetical protein